MKEKLKKFEHKKPEVVFEWNDEETGAEGWVVINSLRGGAAGGGTRMRKGLDKREVESLAKTMEIKFTVAGPPIGGAKSGINFKIFNEKLCLVWNNASFNKGKLIREALKKGNLLEKVHFVNLPSYATDFNTI